MEEGGGVVRFGVDVEFRRRERECTGYKGLYEALEGPDAAFVAAGWDEVAEGAAGWLV